MFKSKCCNAGVKWVMSPDFIGDDPKKMKVGTCSFECEVCGKPCDVNIDPTLSTKKETSSEWSVKITRGNNGYILSNDVEYNPPLVIEDDEKDELKSHENLLCEIINYFNFGGSKHDKVRLRITRVKQKG